MLDGSETTNGLRFAFGIIVFVAILAVIGALGLGLLIGKYFI